MTALVPANIQVPAHLAARIGRPSALAQSLAAGLSTGVSFPRISIKSSRFRIKEGDTETVLDTLALDIVIVGANPSISKQWYEKAWDNDAEPESPDCWSSTGIAPDAQSPNKQNDICATCPKNVWGSRIGPGGQQLKQCSDRKRLAVVSADDPSGPAYLLEVTPAALKGLNQYQKELSIRGIPPEVVKTRISFDSDASFPKLLFGFGGFLSAEEQAAVDPRFGSEEILQITGEAESGVQPIEQPVVVQPKPMLVKPAAPAPAPEPAPAAEPAASKRGFGAKKAAEPAAPAAEAAAPKRGFGAKKTAAAAPAAAPATPAAADASSLADEIAALVGDVVDDE